MKKVIVTRPAAESARWVEHLSGAGWQILSWPLLEFSAPQDTGSLLRARLDCCNYQAIMFVSAQAVTGFFDGTFSVAWENQKNRCWAPGPGTARALLAAGVPASAIDSPSADAEQFDSEALWEVVLHQVSPGHRLLVVRGESAGVGFSDTGQGREWLAHQCREAGGQVDFCVAYRRQKPAWSAEQKYEAHLALKDGSLWLFSSSEALRNLSELLADADYSQARALVTHPRIAAAAKALGFASVRPVRPDPAEVRRALESED